ncbi:hypothetical protein WG908_05035 [Sphingobium sp. AN641]|uniref:hypothetical protein n=1 Tax=Sphingobium sp. AN641 TaxID=3133443 RepID=UPI0030C1093E
MIGRAALLATAALALVAARPPMRVQPNPSAVIAAEIALNRAAQDKGEWTAFRAAAAKDAIMFVPQQVSAMAWLKGRADPPVARVRSPHRVYVACGGRLAASAGNWTRPDGSAGYFTTIWRRDDKGRWQWIMDHADALASPRAAPEFLVGKVATCKRTESPAHASPTFTDAPPSADESLVWTAQVTPDGGRHVMIRMWTGDAYETVIDDQVAAP